MFGKAHFRFTTVTALAIFTASPTVIGQEVEVKTGRSAADADLVEDAVDIDSSREEKVKRQPKKRRHQMDTQVVDWLLSDQTAFLDLAKFGADNANAPAVKQFSQQIVEEHQTFVHQLRQLKSGGMKAHDADDSHPAEARNQRQRPDPRKVLAVVEGIVEEVAEVDIEAKEVTNPAQTARPKAVTDVNVEKIATVAAEVLEEGREIVEEVREERGSLRARGRDERASRRWMTTRNKIAQELTKLAKDDLKKRDGYEFDAALIGMFSASHIQQEATLEVLSQVAEGGAADALQAALQKIRAHRQQADKLMGQIQPDHGKQAQ